MEMILFMGIQATGKSSFYRERFFGTHVRISQDMLKTHRREELLVKACDGLFIPKRIDRVEPRRLPRRILAESDSHGHRDTNGGDDGGQRRQGRPVQEHVNGQ
jgi:hypothetical protein